jgi:methylthioribulose-1-phosphate dehydratase
MASLPAAIITGMANPAIDFESAARALAETARELSARGWTPATSSNFSMRLDETSCAITISGRDKGRLGIDDFMRVDLNGRPLDAGRKPSAETLLHTQLYKRFPEIGVVLHTHSVNQTVASRLFEADGFIELAGYELLKAFRGYETHDALMRVPVFLNTQDMRELAHAVDSLFDAEVPMHAYLISGHGVYTWGRDLAEARRHLEAIEFLLACELELRRYRR